jgi:hypothetical protein
MISSLDYFWAYRHRGKERMGSGWQYAFACQYSKMSLALQIVWRHLSRVKTRAMNSIFDSTMINTEVLYDSRRPCQSRL